MRKYTVGISLCLLAFTGMAQVRGSKTMMPDQLKRVFQHPPESAKPWVFWYWMYGAVTHESVTADLQAMKDAGIGGAYLMPIKAPGAVPLIHKPLVQLSPEWWDMVKFTMQEADRIGVKLAMHDCDGFALAGGPWITPELSMQKVVTVKKFIQGGKIFNDTLPVPPHYKNYYKDIEVLAYPTLPGEGSSSYDVHLKVTTSLAGTDVQYLGERGNKKSFATRENCWLQLAFEKPFTCRSLVIHTVSSNYQSERLEIQVSDDGKIFKSMGRLEPPRHGWQDGDAEITNDIPETTAKYFRFVYDKAGSEPGAEDLDFAKWKPSLKLSGIELSAEPKIHQYESKTGEVWRISKQTTKQQLPDGLCIPADKIINLTNKLGADGKLHWNIPAGNWTIIRIGHTSTGHTNATGGGGIGLECDKFNPEAAKVQFDNWFGEAIKHGGPDLAKRVLKVFHVDSWECGSQNWSPLFAAEFKKRRGYDLLPYMPLFAGVPVQSVQQSEKVLADVRETIAELVVDKFFGTMAKLAHQQGCTFSAECVAPTMVSDDLLHFKMVDVPMGEFWFRSPTHDKPNDMLDAISGGHIYGKNIIQAEAFTELRLFWDEHPGMLKTMADRNFALGINRFVFHVNALNPWLDRKPGMTLDGIGMFFQRDQTWYKPGKAWFDYIQRCQALLQQGHPVTDIAVFSGEETPRRAVLPERLVSTLPGLFGKEAVKLEAERMENKGQPQDTRPQDGGHSANMETAETFTDPLRGYAYDSMNKDALLTATVKDRRIILPGGASYAVLVVPGYSGMNPHAAHLSKAVFEKLQQLLKDGADIIFNTRPTGKNIGYTSNKPGEKFSKEEIIAATNEIGLGKPGDKGSILFGPYQKETLDDLGISRDVIVTETNNPAKDIAWTHRTGDSFEMYFISNQQQQTRNITLSLRVNNKTPELWDAVTGEMHQATGWNNKNGRTQVPVTLAANGSVFVILRDKPASTVAPQSVKVLQTLGDSWQVTFDRAMGGPKNAVAMHTADDWSKNTDPAIRNYSGTATYTQNFSWKGKLQGQLWLDLGKVNNMAEVVVNGKSCDVAWTYPYRVNVTGALRRGNNQVVIKVTNTWANRLMGDHALPEDKRITWTNAPYRLDGHDLLPAGLTAPVKLIEMIDVQ